LADWRDALILDCGALSVVTLLMAGLGTVLVRQLRRHERAEIARRDLERHLHHSQRLESLGTLAGGIAHDLNNALVPILALTKMAMSDTSEGCAIREDLSLVYQAGIRARDLVKRILAFGRKEMGERRRVQINEIAAEAMSMLRSTIPGMITITSEIEDVPPVLGDATEIHQVIVNLATNAVQAIGTGHGTVSIRVSRADMQDGTERQGARVVISDTGCGMSPQTLERIFEPFFTTKAVGEGTGLGLAVVHGIVMGLGGRIDVQSELGRGTSFTLIFPEATLDLASRGEQRRAA
jgi:signal transduction histidine kinase